MPIEFNCTQCSQTLRVPDDTAGKQARCPNCSTILVIPASSPSAPAAPGPAPTPAPQPNPMPQQPGPGQPGFPQQPAQPGAFPGQPQQPFPQPQQPFPQQQQPFPQQQQPFPQQQPFATPQKPGYADPNAYPAPGAYTNPIAGAGFGQGEIHNQRVDAGVIINFAIARWKQQMGLLIGVVIITGMITNVASFAAQIAQAGLLEAREEEMAMLVGMIGALLANVVSIFLGIGQAQIMLKVARGQKAEMNELFSGGPRFLSVLGFSILFGIAITVGFGLCLIPGFIMLLMWWPAYYLVVESKADVMDSFTRAKTITEGNWGTTIVLWFASAGIMIAGLLALCVGIIFAAPLVQMIWCVAYLMMSGQIPNTARL